MCKFYTGSLKFVGLLTQDKTVIKGGILTPVQFVRWGKMKLRERECNERREYLIITLGIEILPWLYSLSFRTWDKIEQSAKALYGLYPFISYIIKQK